MDILHYFHYMTYIT